MKYPMKEVYYDKYCAKCVNLEKKDYEDPCNECLTYPMNLHSHKPIKFREDENKK